MVGPWEVVSVASVAAITEVKEDVNGGPPWEVLLLSSIVVCTDFYKKRCWQ
jgi:hypothetical protein